MERLQAYFKDYGYESELILDGKLHRFPYDKSKDAGWYIGWLHTYEKKEGTYPIAVFGDWKTGSQYTYAPASLSKEDKKSADRKIQTAQRVLAEDKVKKNESASERAAQSYEMGRIKGEHPYLTRKLLTSLFGAVIDQENRLCVPMKDLDGKMWGMQRIAEDGSKRFISGQRTDLCFHVIGGSRPMPGMWITEGFATGASIHMATGDGVIVAFSASNLLKLSRQFAEKFPYGSFKIAGDDDRFTASGNAGRKAADEASIILQCPVSYPHFKSDDDRPTDFNDLHVREGLQAVSKQLKSLRMPTSGFRPIGFDDQAYYIYHVTTACVIKLPLTFSRQHLLKLAPLDYWVRRYSNPDDGKMNWFDVANDIIQKCIGVGPYSITNVRGLGVWLDGDDVIVNEGDRLRINGSITAYSNYAGKYCYASYPDRLRIGDALTVQECEPLLELCTKLNWVNENSGFILAGWLVASTLGGSLPIRPHIALTGPSGAGKSTIMDGIVTPCLGPSAIFSTGATTEAGIRQTVKASSVPVVLDEFEGDTEAARARVDAVMELLRSAHSSSGAKVLKGSLSGNTENYSVAFSAMIAGINLKLTNAADVSRFTVLEIQKKGNSEAQYKPIETLLYKITPEFGQRLRGRAVKYRSQIMQSYEILGKGFQKSLGDMRLGQQMGILYACFWSLMSDEVITKEQAEALIGNFEVHKEAGDTATDEEMCLDRLLTTAVRITNVNGFTSERTIADVIANGTDHDHKQLKKYGVAVVRSKGLYVANRHTYLETKIYANTRWSVWKDSLKRLEGAVADQILWMDKPTKAVLLPLSYLGKSNNNGDITDITEPLGQHNGVSF